MVNDDGQHLMTKLEMKGQIDIQQLGMEQACSLLLDVLLTGYYESWLQSH